MASSSSVSSRIHGTTIARNTGRGLSSVLHSFREARSNIRHPARGEDPEGVVAVYFEMARMSPSNQIVGGNAPEYVVADGIQDDSVAIQGGEIPIP